MKLSELSYRQKNRALLAVALVFAVIAYFYAIAPTLRLASDNQQLRTKIQRAENAPKSIADMKKGLAMLNLKLNNYLVDTTKDHEHTLEVVSEFCHKHRLLVKELPQKSIVEEKDFTIITSVLKIDGQFSELLNLLYELEYNQRLGRVSAVSWKTTLDTKTKRTVLTMIIYLQNITVAPKALS